jgi:phosphate:Na+ symporter
MVTIGIELLGGLGLFISGMNLMSRGIERVAGNKLRSILKAFTKTRLMGVLVGLFFTAVIQSSSAATVMVVSFVNSGLMTLSEACGIILGANIGTTVTALLVAFRLSAMAPIFVFAGAVMVNFIKEPMTRKCGQVVLGFGILFMGISMMSTAMAALREIPAVINLLSNFTNPVLAIVLGLVITSVVQSSSVTVSILVVMASQGLVDLRICMFVILGCNIGACTSAVLTGMSGGRNAKRASLIHLLFNVYGTILMFVLLLFFAPQIEDIIYFFSGHSTDAGTLGRHIAVAHCLFKVFQVIVFFPFMDLIVKNTAFLVKGEDDEDASGEFTLQYIGEKKLPDPSVAAYLAVQEMRRMANMAIDNLNIAVDCLIHRDTANIAQVFETEKYVDFLDEKISNYLVKINQNTLPLADQSMIAAYFHVVSDIERIGDHAENMAEMVTQIQENDIHFAEESVYGLYDMMNLVNQVLSESIDMFVNDDNSKMQEISDIENRIDQMERDLQSQHIKNLKDGLSSAQAGIYFSDIASSLERVADHAINIAFSLVEARSGRGGVMGNK